MEKLKATTAADVLALFPHILGFEPRESFGLMTLQGPALGASLRIDIPTDDISPTGFAQTLTSHLLEDVNADGVLLMVYTNEKPADPNASTKPHKDYVEAMKRELQRGGLPIRDGWLITDQGWTDYFCEDADCCQLRPLSEIDDSIISAHMVFNGSAKRTTLADDPAFIGSDEAERKISETAARMANVAPLDFTDPAHCEARAAWQEGLGTQPDEDEACELVGYLQCKPVRDRLVVDAISYAEDMATIRNVLTGRVSERPDWARVDATEALLLHLLAYTPGAARAELFSFLGWLSWYKGLSSVAVAYFKKALEAQPGHRLTMLLNEMLRTGALPAVSKNPATAYNTPQAD
ncbi:DUF4192 domain-containing protein [Arthrobacter luteolus]|uniref:DUF4192 domain-containing protein n=1 Tax=Arthrobacter luteolus TaxID=98672 RepID=UPI00082CFDC9|nr:DUF4192 domain-containing protein [Arthrobacter luteolus]